jgi:hypothetical protein
VHKKKGNNYWQEAIEKERSKIRDMGAFERYNKATPHQQLHDGSQNSQDFNRLVAI